MLSLFRKKTLLSSGIFNDFTDFHSHILPGVDDGMETMEDALEALEFCESIGVKKMWLTPHIMEDFPNETSFLKSRFNELLSNYHGNIRLHLASENMIDNLFAKRLKERDILPIEDNVLVEMSFYSPPSYLNSILEEIKSAGYFPLLAHPERYVYMNEAQYLSLADNGVRFQISLPSFAGAYGETARRKVNWMREKGLVYCFGTDIHRLESFQVVIKRKY